jgi:hypothetical protein
MVPDGEDGLPTSHRISSNYGVNSFQLLAHVLGSATGFYTRSVFEKGLLDVALLTRVDLESILIRSLVELGLSISCGKRLQELLVWGRESIIDFITRGPKCVYQESELDHKNEGGPEPTTSRLW